LLGGYIALARIQFLINTSGCRRSVMAVHLRAHRKNPDRGLGLGEANRRGLLSPRVTVKYFASGCWNDLLCGDCFRAWRGNGFPQPRHAGPRCFALARGRSRAAWALASVDYPTNAATPPLFKMNQSTNLSLKSKISARIRRIHCGAQPEFAVQPGDSSASSERNGAGKPRPAASRDTACIAGTVRIVARHRTEPSPQAAVRLRADTIHPYDVLTVTEHLHFIALA